MVYGFILTNLLRYRVEMTRTVNRKLTPQLTQRSASWITQWPSKILITLCLSIGILGGTFGLLPQSSYAYTIPEHLQNSPMVIEWLKIEVSPEYRDRYLQADAAIWTKALHTYPGFIDKMTWLNPDNPAEVIFVIRWASREQWKAIPEAELEKVNQEFDAAFPFNYTLSEEKEFQVFHSKSLPV
jgi:uncharacterized protein (TIGR03792 family)